jgi:hypothetical protein
MGSTMPITVPRMMSGTIAKMTENMADHMGEDGGAPSDI